MNKQLNRNLKYIDIVFPENGYFFKKDNDFYWIYEFYDNYQDGIGGRTIKIYKDYKLVNEIYTFNSIETYTDEEISEFCITK